MTLALVIKNMLIEGLERFGLYYSTYQAFVADREDPQQYGRLKLVIPMLTGINVYQYWAWQKGCFSGKGYGFQNLPQKGDTVWVEFERGHPSKPIWTYGYFGKDEKPNDLKGYDKRWLKTPAGHLILLDDTKNQEEITVQHTNGVKYVINSNGFSVVRNNKKIFLGDLNSAAEPVVLGDKNADVLTDIYQVLLQINTMLQSLGTADAAAASTVGLTYASVMASLSATLQPTIAQLPQKIQTTKSNHVKTD